MASAFLHASWYAVAKTTNDKKAFLFGAMTISNLLIALSFFYYHYDFTVGTSIIWQGLGAVAVLGGIVVLSFPDVKKDQKLESSKSANVPWAWVCAFFIGGYHLSYHQALHHGAEPISLFAVAMLISWPFLWFAMKGERKLRIQNIFHREWRKILSVGVACNLSFVIFLYGLQVSVPVFAISLRNSSIFFAILYSFLLKESLSRIQVFGALVVGMGALILSLH